eukprot:scaffold60809_cov67-Phaeocystis_antarctica.AAC.4
MRKARSHPPLSPPPRESSCKISPNIVLSSTRAISARVPRSRPGAGANNSAFRIQAARGRRDDSNQAEHSSYLVPLHLLHKVEGRLPLARALAHADQRVVRDRVARYPLLLHRRCQLHRLLPRAAALARLDGRVVHDGILLYSSALHLLEQRERFPPLPRLRAGRDRRTVGDCVAQPLRRGHAQQLDRLL